MRIRRIKSEANRPAPIEVDPAQQALFDVATTPQGRLAIAEARTDTESVNSPADHRTGGASL